MFLISFPDIVEIWGYVLVSKVVTLMKALIAWVYLWRNSEVQPRQMAHPGEMKVEGQETASVS